MQYFPRQLAKTPGCGSVFPAPNMDAICFASPMVRSSIFIETPCGRAAKCESRPGDVSRGRGGQRSASTMALNSLSLTCCSSDRWLYGTQHGCSFFSGCFTGPYFHPSATFSANPLSCDCDGLACGL